PHYTFQRYPGIFNSSTADSFLQSKVSNIFSGRLTALELFDILDHYAQNCDAVVGNEEVMTQLKDAKFDLLLVDPNEMCGFVIAHILGVPYAVFSTGLWYPAEVGAPAPLSYVPEFNSLLTDRMSLVQRITNTVVYLVSRFGVQYLVLPKYERIMRKHGVEPRVAMQDLVQGAGCGCCLLIWPWVSRPTLPHVVYVGGYLPNLPARYLSMALVSFGAGVKYLSEDITHKLAGALGRLPQRVVWRFSGVPPSNLGNNTKLVDWMPQNDLLGHARTVAFLSHGGLNSIYEAMYHGVPVVGLPLFGDHYDTMTRVEAKGMGIMVHWKSMTEEELYQALATVINNNKYRQRAQVLSSIHKDQPGHPVTRAVYWINYILRHHGANHLRSSVYTVPTYQYFLLDVVLVVGAGLALIAYLFYRIAGLLRSRLRFRSGGEVTHGDGDDKANGHCHSNGAVANGKHKRNGASVKNDKKMK
ncbi:2-hydroxyacylsphingosine 1-beta-galactosyltransferase-like, partial [Oncorhynchus keta]|uniref:2-hydroxyacylsphingosine 1-beta-galactosyltransferase-like n=1 Tax=Oncorhynchus keta TaxID=8018 RepID=UPI00227C58CB